MLELAITQGAAFVAYARNAKAIALPDGTTVLGPLDMAALPYVSGDFAIRVVVVDGTEAGPLEIGGTAPPVVEGDAVVVRRTVQAMPEEMAGGVLDQARIEAIASIRAGAGTARDGFRTPGKDGVYLTKLTEGRAWITAGQPEDLTAYPSIKAEVGVTAPTASALVALWEAMNELWTMRALPAIEGAEQRALKAVAEATTLAQIAEAKTVVWPKPEDFA